MREYDLIADWYASDRSRKIGVAEALAVADTLRPGARILDLGCGNGVPITEALVNAGYQVIGLDASAAMLVRFRANLPMTTAVRGDVRQCPFADGSFDAAVSWGMMFHLPRADQAAAFASVSRVLTMNGVTFHYYAVPSYRRLLAAHGFVLVNVYDDPGVSTYFLARTISA